MHRPEMAEVATVWTLARLPDQHRFDLGEGASDLGRLDIEVELRKRTYIFLVALLRAPWIFPVVNACSERRTRIASQTMVSRSEAA